MSGTITGKTIRYRVQDVGGQVLAVFSSKKLAIKKTINFAVEFPGTRFIVMSKTLLREKKIFSFVFDAQFNFTSAKDVYAAFSEIFEQKHKNTKGWFKP